MLGLPPSRPIQPGELDQILEELAERGIEPNRLRVLRRAVERGCPSDLAAAVTDAFDHRHEEAQAIEESR